ncbi:hypothetical protein ACOZ4L_04995 [Haloplanus ruber]|uniref:Uracil-DNA glycosylase-like domain-containing protein n=1 Tax=Haloplanus ruber TaxID=869892 RepID=A0ABD6D1M7_9EURY|nr:hypothetical protein [Haloplanus ruber]
MVGKKRFNQFRLEMWRRIRDNLGTDITTEDYFKYATGKEDVPEWCLDHPDSLHSFTRYYPYANQPIALVLDNPRLDVGEPKPNQTKERSDRFPTLEHCRYALTESTNIEQLARISSEHYNSYFTGKGPTERLFIALGTIFDSLNISDVVNKVSEQNQWDPIGTDSATKMNAPVSDWKDYFYNPSNVGNQYLELIEGCTEPHPLESLHVNIGEMEIKADSEGLSGCKPDPEWGLYSDFYITNRYKFGTPESSNIPVCSTSEHLHEQLLFGGLTAEKGLLQKGELDYLAPKLIIGFGKHAQKGLISSAEPVYVHEHASNDRATTNNFGTVWQRQSGEYVLFAPHPGHWGSNLGEPFEDGYAEGWEHLDRALLALESELLL